jgi:hypothetical protein
MAEEEAKAEECERADKAAVMVSSNMQAAADPNNVNNNNISRRSSGLSQQQPQPGAYKAGGGAGGAGPSRAGVGDDDESDAEGLPPAEHNLWDKAELDRVIQQVAVSARGDQAPVIFATQSSKWAPPRLSTPLFNLTRSKLQTNPHPSVHTIRQHTARQPKRHERRSSEPSSLSLSLCLSLKD